MGLPPENDCRKAELVSDVYWHLSREIVSGLQTIHRVALCLLCLWEKPSF